MLLIRKHLKEIWVINLFKKYTQTLHPTIGFYDTNISIKWTETCLIGPQYQESCGLLMIDIFEKFKCCLYMSLDYDWLFLKWHWKKCIPPTSIVLPSSTSCSRPANSRNDSAVEGNRTYESNVKAWANMQNVLRPMDKNTQTHSNNNASMPAHKNTTQKLAIIQSG